MGLQIPILYAVSRRHLLGPLACVHSCNLRKVLLQHLFPAGCTLLDLLLSGNLIHFLVAFVAGSATHIKHSHRNSLLC